MEVLAQIIDAVNNVLRWPLVIGLLGTGLFLTVRLGFIQFRRLGHGVAVATGRYDDPDEPGDVSHFQALTTALSATVGVGNIAGVAYAIHIGGPGALFWMWITALLGMATKYGEVTLAQHYRDVHHDEDGKAWEGSVSGGPMYYIERGLGKAWKPVAVFFAFALMVTSFMTGNAVQANTVAIQVADSFGVATWITGLVTATIVGVVILGGISRIGRVTSVVAPLMAAVYVAGALVILVLNVGDIPAAFGTIVTEAFNPRAGVAGTGVGLLLTTMMFGVQRGLFSNEAGQGSAPIAHSAAKTDEPVSEGAVALLEPFIDTIIICTMTGLVLVTTGAYSATTPTEFSLMGANVSFVEGDREAGFSPYENADPLVFKEGIPQILDGARVGRFDVGIDTLFVDPAQTVPFEGTIDPATRRALDEAGVEVGTFYANTVRNSAPLTTLAFELGLGPIGLGRGRPGDRPVLGHPVRDLDLDLVELLRRPLRELPVRAQGDLAVQGRLRGDALRRRRPRDHDDLGPRRRGAVPRHAPERARAHPPLGHAQKADRQLLRAGAVARERRGPQAGRGRAEGGPAPMRGAEGWGVEG